ECDRAYGQVHTVPFAVDEGSRQFELRRALHQPEEFVVERLRGGPVGELRQRKAEHVLRTVAEGSFQRAAVDVGYASAAVDGPDDVARRLDERAKQCVVR